MSCMCTHVSYEMSRVHLQLKEVWHRPANMVIGLHVPNCVQVISHPLHPHMSLAVHCAVCCLRPESKCKEALEVVLLVRSMPTHTHGHMQCFGSSLELKIISIQLVCGVSVYSSFLGSERNPDFGWPPYTAWQEYISPACLPQRQCKKLLVNITSTLTV